MEISVDTGDRCYQYKYLSGYHDIILYYIYYFLFLYFFKDGADIESFHRENVNRGILVLLIFSYI